MIVIAAVTVVVVAIIAPVVGAMILLIGLKSPANVFLDLLVGLVSVCPFLRHREQVLDTVGPLTEQLGPESIMVVETFDEHEDIFITIDVRDGYPHFQEMTNVVKQWFIWIVSDFLQIVLVVGC
jgi:hypothetical protein